MAVCYNKSAYRYPGLLIGIGTHIEPEKAIQKALFEMEISLLDVLEKSRKRKIRFHSISRPYDHKVLYLSPAMRKHWYFMINSKNEIHQLRTMKRPIKNNSNKILFQVASRLHRMNHNVIYCDITPVDMRNIGLSAVKVFVTGLQPLYFGNDPRLSLQRLMAVPVRLGYRSKPSSVFEMNPLPHPLP
jgi:thiazole/oxazole-forming peptide maturase SagD family component